MQIYLLNYNDYFYLKNFVKTLLILNMILLV